MTNPLHAAYYADRAVQQTVEVVENVRLARDTYRVRFRCPAIARRITPGQFLMLRLSNCDDPLIGRPFALYDTFTEDGEPTCVDMVYLSKGKLTTRLGRFRPGQQLDVWGPLGNGFDVQTVDHLIMVAGGIGQTPFLALGQEALGLKQFGDPARSVPTVPRVTLCYGARTEDRLAGVEDFEKTGMEIRLCTDDGSRGHHGLVTELLLRLLDEPRSGQCRVVCCGPEPMMKAVAGVAAERNTQCLVSLETPMACGIGICFSCVAPVRDKHGEVDFKRTCVDGPVFDGARIQWE